MWLLPIWLVVLLVLVGWGLAVTCALCRLGGAGFGGRLGVFQTMWLGFAGLIAFLQLCSFVLPIAGIALGLSILPALGGYVLERRAVVCWARSLRVRDRRPLVVALCIVMLSSFVVAWTCSNAVNWFDTGLYHLAAVKWFATYPVVPGLANLHLRFGYNNSVHLFGAYVDTFWQGVAVHAMTGFLMATLLAQWFVEIFTARGPRGRLRQVFCLLTLPFLLAKLWTIEMASLSTDLALAVICFVLVLELVSLQTDARRRVMLPLALVVALGAVATATKLGGLAAAAVVGALAIYLVRGDVRWRARAAIFALPLVIVAGWMLRGLVLSGWLIFPVVGRIGFPWAVRPRVAEAHLLEIQSWGRVFGKGPDEVFRHGFWGWFPIWLNSVRTSHELALLVASTAAFAWRMATGPVRRVVRNRAHMAALAVCALGIVQWFVGAPDLRYGAFWFWLLAAVLFAPLLARAMHDATQRGFVLVMALALAYWHGGFTIELGRPPSLLERPPDPVQGATVPMQAGPHTTIYFPTHDAQCWDAHLLCTPTPGKQTLRDPHSFAAGFLPGPPNSQR